MSAKILLVEDEPSIRISLSEILSDVGYLVRLAEDGFSALREIRQEMPDILISDLYMPGMSGFELFSVVRQRFPVILTVAMSGAYAGSDVPSGIVADAFYAKGGGVEALLQILQTLPLAERHSVQTSSATAPLWIYRSESDTSQGAGIAIACPECLRTFSQDLSRTADQTQKTQCVYCHSLIHFAIALPADSSSLSPLPPALAEDESVPKVANQYYYY